MCLQIYQFQPWILYWENNGRRHPHELFSPSLQMEHTYEIINWSLGDAIPVGLSDGGFFPLRNTEKKALQGGHPSGERCINKQKDRCICTCFGKKTRRSIGGDLQGSFYRITNCKRCILPNHSKLASLKLREFLQIGLPKRKAVFQQSNFRCVCCQFPGEYHHTFALDHFLNHLYI